MKIKVLNTFCPKVSWIPVCKTGDFVLYGGMIISNGTEVMPFDSEEGSWTFTESKGVRFCEVLSGIWVGARFVIPPELILIQSEENNPNALVAFNPTL